MAEGSEQISLLMESLKHPDKKAVRQAAETLISMAPRLPQLSEKLHQMLSKTPAEKRWPIAYVLAHISPPSPACLDALKETLDTKDPDIRWAVVLLLTRLGKNDCAVASLLRDLVKSGTPTQRRMAVYCLRDMNLKDKLFTETLLEALCDPDPLVRVAAVTSLGGSAEIGKAGVDSLLHLFLHDSDSRVRYSAALTLARVTEPTDEIRKALTDASRSEDPQLQKAANAALHLLKKTDPPLA